MIENPPCATTLVPYGNIPQYATRDQTLMEWEYKKISLNDVSRRADDIDLLNDAGKEGWELVGITINNVAYLKRRPGEPVRAQSVRRKAAPPRAVET